MVRIGVTTSILTLMVLVLAWVGLSKSHAHSHTYLQSSPAKRAERDFQTSSGVAESNAKSDACDISAADAAGLNGDFSADIHAFSEFTDTAARMVNEEKFAELDCLADQARSGKERLPGGLWKVHLLYQGLPQPVPSSMHATEEDWTNLLQHLQRWTKASPESVTARVALALAYLHYAYNARGTGYANTVSESGWKLYKERIGEARRILEEASTLPVKCPEWYVAMQMVSVYQGWSETEARALFEEANKFEPEYYTYARDLAYYLLPKWNGKPGDTEEFAREIADRIGGDKGDILYFQIAAANYVVCGCDGDPQLSMDRIKRGFEASERLYGVSMQNLNRMAYLASHYGPGDYIYANKMFIRIGDEWDPETWGNEDYFRTNKRVVSASAPYLAEILVFEAKAAANEQTPEGARYEKAFERKYREVIQQCVRSDGGSVAEWKGEFKTLTNLGAKGTVEDFRIQSVGPVVACLAAKLHDFREENATPFPPPPQAAYWVELHLDWGDFAPIPAK